MHLNKKMKVISLPINFIVILAVAIIVLVVAVTLILHSTDIVYIDDLKAWTQGCGVWKQRGCSENDINNIIIANYDPNKDGVPDNLMTACQRYLQYTSVEDCKKACC